MVKSDASTAFINNIMAAYHRKALEFTTSHSKFAWQLICLMKQEDLITDCELVKEGGHNAIKVCPKYKNGEPAFRRIVQAGRFDSAGSLKIKDLEKLAGNKNQIIILHTSSGLLTAQQAIQKRTGGQCAFTILR